MIIRRRDGRVWLDFWRIKVRSFGIRNSIEKYLKGSSKSPVRSTPHSTKVHDLHLSLFYPLLFHYLIIFWQQCVHLISIWLEYHSLFRNMCFCIQVWEYDMPTSTHSSIPTLDIIFQFYTYIGDNEWFKFGGMEKQILSKINVMSFLSMWSIFDFDLNYMGRLKVMNTWSYDLGILSLVTYFWQHEMLLVSI